MTANTSRVTYLWQVMTAAEWDIQDSGQRQWQQQQHRQKRRGKKKKQKQQQE